MPTAAPTQNIDYAELARAFMKEVGFAAQTQKVVSGTANAVYGHGRGGLFSGPGLSRPLFSAMLLPQQGLMSLLSARPTNETDPLFGIITGVTAGSGDEPSTACGDWPETGLVKLCTHTFVFGKMGRQTRVYDLSRMGETTNRGEMWDFQVFGDPFAPEGANTNVPTLPGASGLSQAVNSEIAKAMFEFAVTWARDFAGDVYTANPANNVGGVAGDGRKFFYGLDLLINTGYRDAETGVACPAADSMIVSFAGLDVATNGGYLVRVLTSMFRNLRHLANRAKLSPVNWVIAMPWTLFYEITEVWPCAYMTYRCQNTGDLSAGQTAQIPASDLVNMRDQMRGNQDDRTGQYLLIDGNKVAICIDDTITETEVNPGQFQAQIYIVPLTVLGNVPVTYFEYFNFDTPDGAMAASKIFAPDGMFYTTDGGRFLWHRKVPTNYCVQVQAISRTRLLLLTPYLAARLHSIRWTPLMHEKSWKPGDTYFYDGGKTDRKGLVPPSFYTPLDIGLDPLRPPT